MMSKKQVVKKFKQEVLPLIHMHSQRVDQAAMREAWNIYTSSLHQDRLISDHAYNNWVCPYIKTAN